MNSNADSEGILRVGNFYTLLDLTLTLYEPDPEDRLFPFTKSYFHHQMTDGCAAAGIEKIRLHDLRHSHASLLIHLGMPILLVSERLGHEDVQTTLRTYGHLYPSTTSDAISALDKLMPGGAEDAEKTENSTP